MTFEQWFADMQDRYDANYSGYEDLLKECWEAAQKAEQTRIAKLLDGMDKTQTISDKGWWETNTGAEFGATLLSRINTHPQQQEIK
jgi:hypothetical protein